MTPSCNRSSRDATDGYMMCPARAAVVQVQAQERARQADDKRSEAKQTEAVAAWAAAVTDDGPKAAAVAKPAVTGGGAAQAPRDPVRLPPPQPLSSLHCRFRLASAAPPVWCPVCGARGQYVRFFLPGRGPGAQEACEQRLEKDPQSGGAQPRNL